MLGSVGPADSLLCGLAGHPIGCSRSVSGQQASERESRWLGRLGALGSRGRSPAGRGKARSSRAGANFCYPLRATVVEPPVRRPHAGRLGPGGIPTKSKGMLRAFHANQSSPEVRSPARNSLLTISRYDTTSRGPDPEHVHEDRILLPMQDLISDVNVHRGAEN